MRPTTPVPNCGESTNTYRFSCPVSEPRNETSADTAPLISSSAPCDPATASIWMKPVNVITPPHMHISSETLSSAGILASSTVAAPGTRLVVYTPADDACRAALDSLIAAEGADVRYPCWPAHQHASQAAGAS